MGIVLPLAAARQRLFVSGRGRSFVGSTTMSSSTTGNGTNGPVTLRSFAELASVLDRQSAARSARDR